MKVRRLVFDATPEHKLFFRLCYEAFVRRGGRPERDGVSPSEKRSERTILRALKAVSQPVGVPPEDGEPDLRFRKLKDDGGTVDLASEEFKRLFGYVEAMPWGSVVTDVAIDLQEWLDDADKVEVTP